MIGKTILYTGRCRKNATVSESFDCQEEERIDLLPEVTDKRWLPAFFHALYLLSIKLSIFCNLEYDMYVMKILITNSNSFYIMKIEHFYEKNMLRSMGYLWIKEHMYGILNQ